MELTDIHVIHALLEKHGFRFSKSLGQNFLCAAWVPERIAACAGLDGETGVLEVGPGVGCLTEQLAQRAKKVVSLELDRRLQPILAETLAAYDNVEIVYADLLKTDLAALLRDRFPDCAHLAVCANLPYNITTPALTAFAEQAELGRITVMIQREVARRICAPENTADYGAFTVLMQWHYETALCFDVPPGCFIPAPKVTSSVLTLNRRAAPPVPVADEKRMFAIVRAAFNQRRKTLCNALVNGLGVGREEALAAVRAIGAPDTVRGEALSLAQFAALSDALFLP